MVIAPGALQITGVTLSLAGAITLDWATQPGKTYQVQFKNDLNEVSWHDIGAPTTNQPGATFTDPIGSSAQRFYRIIAY